MSTLNLIEDTMKSFDNVIFRAISEIRGKLKYPDKS